MDEWAPNGHGCGLPETFKMQKISGVVKQEESEYSRFYLFQKVEKKLEDENIAVWEISK